MKEEAQLRKLQKGGTMAARKELGKERGLCNYIKHGAKCIRCNSEGCMHNSNRQQRRAQYTLSTGTGDRTKGYCSSGGCTNNANAHRGGVCKRYVENRHTQAMQQ